MTSLNPSAPLPDEPVGMLAQIRASLNVMSASERKVAETVLANVQAVMSWSLADAAKIAAVSEPTVIRFCRRLGFDGYSDFRIKFAQAVALLGKNEQASHAPIDDPARAALAAVGQTAIGAINDMMLDFDAQAVEQAVSILANARRIDIYGHGASGFLAAEMQIRLARIGKPSAAYPDPALQMFSSLSLQDSDVVFALSFSGVTTYLMPNLEIARTGGAKILSMSPSGSPIAQAADVNIPINAYRQKNPAKFLTTERVAMLVMIDALIGLVTDRLKT